MVWRLVQRGTKEAPDVFLSCVAMDVMPQDETMMKWQAEVSFLRRSKILEFQMRFLGRVVDVRARVFA